MNRQKSHRSTTLKSRFLPAAVILAAVWWLVGPMILDAQQRRGAVEGFGGWAGFIDDSTKHHGLLGGTARFYLTPRLAFGPEFATMWGPGADHDHMLTGNLTVDLRSPATPGTTSRWTPYLVVGGGFFQHRDRFLQGPFTSTEPAFTFGGGIRAYVTDRVYVAPDVRIGWELHLRAGAGAGFEF